jgi:site-specific DNA-methyltransferase (adenine-specific)
MLAVRTVSCPLAKRLIHFHGRRANPFRVGGAFSARAGAPLGEPPNFEGCARQTDRDSLAHNLAVDASRITISGKWLSGVLNPDIVLRRTKLGAFCARYRAGLPCAEVLAPPRRVRSCAMRMCTVADDFAPGDDLLIAGDNARALAKLPEALFDLVYMDPPFNTGRVRTRHTVAARSEPDGERVGFGGRRYRTRLLQSLSYDDAFGDYLSFLESRLVRLHELLAPHGTLYFHIDYRESHYCKLLLDEVFGRDAFLNEIIWSYDYGGKPRRRWPAKHDTILAYVRTPGAHHFDADAVEREPYMAPGLVGPEKARRGKRPTDVWFHTIVPTNGREKTGYPTQKPERVVRRLVAASSRPGGWCLDPFAGSGTLGAVCRELGRRFVLIDSSTAALEVMKTRLGLEPA